MNLCETMMVLSLVKQIYIQHTFTLSIIGYETVHVICTIYLPTMSANLLSCPPISLYI